jgi:hypothetical protein
MTTISYYLTTTFSGEAVYLWNMLRVVNDHKLGIETQAGTAVFESMTRFKFI